MTRLTLTWLKEYNLLIHDEIDSTNSEAIRLARSGVSGNFVVWAHKQNHGRGSNMRSWYSGTENLTVSILLNTNARCEILSQITFVASLAVHDTVTAIFKQYKVSDKVQLKWPNDALVNNHKIAGILLEAINIRQYARNYIIIGFGINVNESPYIADKLITNCKEFCKSAIDIGFVLDKLVTYFDIYYKQWSLNGFVIIRNLWLKKAYLIGKVITINSGNNRISGTFLDIDYSGSIRIKLAGGRIHYVSTGEIFV